MESEFKINGYKMNKKHKKGYFYFNMKNKTF